MADKKRYRVTVPRKYTKDGTERTHYWTVGMVFEIAPREGEEPRADGAPRGYSGELYSRVLPTDKIVLWLDEPRERRQGTAPAGAEDDPEDDVPF